MIKNENTSRHDADKLIKLTRNIPCKINLIPCNSLDEAFKRPSETEGLQFKSYLEKANVSAFIRKTKGRSIEAACGMLHNTISTQEPIISGAN